MNGKQGILLLRRALCWGGEQIGTDGAYSPKSVAGLKTHGPLVQDARDIDTVAATSPPKPLATFAVGQETVITTRLVPLPLLATMSPEQLSSLIPSLVVAMPTIPPAFLPSAALDDDSVTSALQVDLIDLAMRPAGKEPTVCLLSDLPAVPLGGHGGGGDGGLPLLPHQSPFVSPSGRIYLEVTRVPLPTPAGGNQDDAAWRSLVTAQRLQREEEEQRAADETANYARDLRALLSSNPDVRKAVVEVAGHWGSLEATTESVLLGEQLSESALPRCPLESFSTTLGYR